MSCLKRQSAVFFLLGLLLFQLTGLSCLGEAELTSSNGNEDALVVIPSSASNLDQDDCPCHLFFNPPRPLHTETAYLLGLATTIRTESFAPTLSYELFHPPLLS